MYRSYPCLIFTIEKALRRTVAVFFELCYIEGAFRAALLSIECVFNLRQFYILK